MKLRHQVETRMPGHTEVVDGFLVLARPESFWVRAMSPLGGTLFDLRTMSGGRVVLDTPIAAIADARAPFYMARDIRRIFIRECDADAEVRPVKGGFRVSCVLPPVEQPIMSDRGPDLPDDALAEMMRLARDSVRHLRIVYRPDGWNVGMNLGQSAGAGIASHAHMHVLPRWAGDTSFVTTTGETRVVPEALETTWEKLSAAFRAAGQACLAPTTLDRRP